MQRETRVNSKLNFIVAADEQITTMDLKHKSNQAIIFTSNITIAKQIIRKLGTPYKHDLTGAEWYTTINDLMRFNITLFQKRDEV